LAAAIGSTSAIGAESADEIARLEHPHKHQKAQRGDTEGGTGMITRVDASGAQIYYSRAIELPGGQITASGLGSPDPRKHLAVAGGTGIFTGARGSSRVLENDDDAGTLQITLR
jgi:hypothetical protein